jgi:hypothetical protein
MVMSEHDYLFDKSGEPDPDVARLEQLLGRFRHGQQRRPARRRAAWLWLLPALAAAGVAVWSCWPSPPDQSRYDVVRRGGGAVERDGWIEAANEAEHLTVANVGWMTLAPGSRLRVRQLDDEQGRFYLAHGNLEAFVFPSVKPRFFQVETEATTCVDLGCQYVLDVDPKTKVAHVKVTLGQVAFTDQGREVFVPRDAECSAVPGRGAGTPRLVDCADELRQRLDAFDAARDVTAQRAAAAAVAAAAKQERDTLPLWHLLAHGDGEVRTVAERALVALVKDPPAARTPAAWREALEPLWW